MTMVDQMRSDFNSEVFGHERGDGFKSAIEQIRQVFSRMNCTHHLKRKQRLCFT